MKNKLFLGILLVATLFPTTSPVHAAGTSTGFAAEMRAQTQAAAGADGAGFGIAQDPRRTAARIVQVFLSIIGVLLLIYITYGGALIFTSAGSEDKINEGKSVIRRAVLGLIIILSAYSITILVTKIVVGTEDCAPDANGDYNCDLVAPDRTKFNTGGYQDDTNPFTGYDCKYLPDGTCDLSN